MALNPYFNQSYAQEQDLYEDLIIEAIQQFGTEVYFIPKVIDSEVPVIGEPDKARFEKAYEFEMYIETFDGFQGESNLFGKFGIEMRDQITFVISKKRWKEQIGYELGEGRTRPFEGDLIYLPLAKSLFMIQFVEHEQPFYQLNNLPVFKLQCELFEYTGESFDTGIFEVDKYEITYGSGGTKMLVEIIPPYPSLNRIKMGELFVQNGISAKLYSIDEYSDSPLLHEITVGQIKGELQVSDSNLLSGVDTGLQFKIVRIYDLDNSETDEDLFPQDVHTDNVTLERQAEEIRTFDEDNPFGEY